MFVSVAFSLFCIRVCRHQLRDAVGSPDGRLSRAAWRKTNRLVGCELNWVDWSLVAGECSLAGSPLGRAGRSGEETKETLSDRAGWTGRTLRAQQARRRPHKQPVVCWCCGRQSVGLSGSSAEVCSKQFAVCQIASLSVADLARARARVRATSECCLRRSPVY